MGATANKKRPSAEKPSAEAIVIDTNVAIHDPESIDVLRENGRTLFIPLAVIHELEALEDKPDIGIDARDALKRIEELTLGGERSLRIIRKPIFKGLDDLDKKRPDHQIIAAANTVAKKMMAEFSTVLLISRDCPVRILAREFGLAAEDYARDETVISDAYSLLPKINVSYNSISPDLSFPYALAEEHASIPENGGVICYSNWSGRPTERITDDANWDIHFAAVRRGDRFQIIPKNIELAGLKPYSLNGNGMNWHQNVAFSHLLNPNISLVFLQGGAGSGKTLLAMAAAVATRSDYWQVLVTRPMIHLENQDNMGFLPGSIDEKTGPWMRPILDALAVLKEKNPSLGKIIEDMIKNKKMEFEPLDYIRGRHIYKCVLIVDESQNLTPHQMKTIITRAGQYTKIIFTGDLGQIDLNRRLDRRSSGLAYAIGRMVGIEEECKIVAAVNFRETVRSDLANLATKRL